MKKYTWLILMSLITDCALWSQNSLSTSPAFGSISAAGTGTTLSCSISNDDIKLIKTYKIDENSKEEKGTYELNIKDLGIVEKVDEMQLNSDPRDFSWVEKIMEEYKQYVKFTSTDNYKEEEYLAMNEKRKEKNKKQEETVIAENIPQKESIINKPHNESFWNKIKKKFTRKKQESKENYQPISEAPVEVQKEAEKFMEEKYNNPDSDLNKKLAKIHEDFVNYDISAREKEIRARFKFADPNVLRRHYYFYPSFSKRVQTTQTIVSNDLSKLSQEQRDRVEQYRKDINDPDSLLYQRVNRIFTRMEYTNSTYDRIWSR